MIQLIRTVSEVIGTIYLFKLLLKVILKLFKTGKGVEWRGGPTTWAIITGSTDGIGLAYALQLAEKGYNLLLISRNAEKLSKVSANIQSVHKNCRIRCLAIDFTKNDFYQQIEAEVKQLEEIHVLVNNVGMTYPNECSEYFTRIPELTEFINSCININIIACTRLMAIVLPLMEVRGRGIIINVSSYAARNPMPMLSLYSASKVFMDYLSRGLNEEYKRKGIVIQSVLPFFVSTKMTKNVKTSVFIPTPERYVRSALKTVGTEAQTFGYFGHKLIACIQDFVYDLFGNGFAIQMSLIQMKEIRRRILAEEDLSEFNLNLFLPKKSTKRE